MAAITAQAKPERRHALRSPTLYAILPSIIDTPQNRAAMPDADHTAWVRPREIADAIAFLLAEDASGVTGAFIPVSGRV